MARMYSVDEQLSVLSPQQLEELKQELIKQRDEEVALENNQRTREDAAQTNKRETRAILAKGLVRGITAFGRGALAGFQGRQPTEPEQPSTTNKYEELLRTEQLKNQVDPSRIKAQQDIEDERLKQKVRQRKLFEQKSIDTTDVQEKNISSNQISTEIEPPKRTKIGEDEYGLDIYGNNPDWELWKEKETEKRKERIDISQEERSIDLIARKAAEKDRQLNISKIGRLTNLVDLIETEYSKTKTPGGTSGLFRRPAEALTKGLQVTENQRQDSAYASFVNGLKVQLARALSEVGNLSETEQRSALLLVPTLLDDPRTADLKLNQLRSLVQKVQNSQNETIPRNRITPQNEITPEQAIEELRRRGIK